MFKKLAPLFCLVGILLSIQCKADKPCIDLLRKVTAASPANSPDVEQDGGPPVCKVLPGETAKTVMLYADTLLLVDSRNGRVLSSGPAETAPEAHTFEIDTGRYWLKSGTRAFGIRSYKYRPHYHVGENVASLSLYIVDGAHIRPVLRDLDLGSSASGTDCRKDDDPGTCRSFQVEERLVIAVSATRHRGYADLLVSPETRDCDDGTGHEHACDNFDSIAFKKSGPTTTLQFDGHQYPVPALMSSEDQ